jgi:ribosomal protein L37AE/L43A
MTTCKELPALIAIGATLAASTVLALPVNAQSKMAGDHGAMMSHHMMSHSKMAMGKSSGVYVCKMCKAYYTPMEAKKMGYKDGMGHMMTKMSKAPSGYMNGSKMMSDKMMDKSEMHDKMMDKSKMGGKMMNKSKM